MMAQGSLSEARILRFAERVGIDTDLIKKEIRSVEISAMLQRNFDLARRLGVEGNASFHNWRQDRPWVHRFEGPKVSHYGSAKERISRGLFLQRH